LPKQRQSPASLACLTKIVAFDYAKTAAHRISELGQSRRFGCASVISGPPLTADI
jgi:hypothetical protein